MGVVTSLGQGQGGHLGGADGRPLGHSRASTASRPRACAPRLRAPSTSSRSSPSARRCSPSVWRCWRPRRRSASPGCRRTAISRARCSSPCRRSRWNGRSAQALAEASGQNGDVTYKDLLKAAATGRFKAWHDLFIFGTVADRIADRFGTKGSPISLSTACSSGATAIQLGVEAIRRGETDAALCIGTDGSVHPESLIRFSLLSALSTQNEQSGGRVEAVLQEPRRLRHGRGRRGARARERRGGAKARGADNPRLRARLRREGRRLPPHPLEPGRRADHRGDPRARSTMPASPPTTSTTSTPTAPRRPRTTRWRRMSCMAVFGERMAIGADLVEQVDDRPHADRRRRGRGGDVAPDDRATAASRRRSTTSVPDPAIPLDVVPNVARDARSCIRAVELLRLRRPEHLPRLRRRAEVTDGGFSSPAAAKGVGAAIVRALVAAGHDVDFTYRSSGDAAEALADELMRPIRAAPSRRMRSICPTRARSTSSATRSRGRASSASSTTPASPTTRLPP